MLVQLYYDHGDAELLQNVQLAWVVRLVLTAGCLQQLAANWPALLAPALELAADFAVLPAANLRVHVARVGGFAHVAHLVDITDVEPAARQVPAEV